MLSPVDEDALAEAVASARGPLSIRGGGTRGLLADGEALSTAALSGITLYEPGALTLVAKAGTAVAEIEAALDGEGQMLAFEPMDHRRLLGTYGEPTIGGVAAMNVSGSRRVQAGAARDFMLGVRFVDGRGTVVKNGGRVMKNVTGYDLVKLMAGSHGTLGILSEIAFKVLPRPEAVGTVRIEGKGVAEGVKALAEALKSPFDVTGAAYADGAALVRVEGFEASVSYRASRLSELLERFGDVSVDVTDFRSGSVWRGIRDVVAFSAREGDVWALSVKPSDAPRVVAAAGRLGAEALLDWGGGRVWLLAPEGTDIRPSVGAGHARLVRASTETRARLGTFQPEPPPLRALADGLRSRFDPRGILNPGLMG